MSLHSLDLECIGRDTRDGRQVLWQATCDCGWEGHEHDTAGTSNATKRARREYQAHVEASLGAAAYYTAPVGCANCSYEGEANVLVGTDVWGATCPRCGAGGRLRPNNEWIGERGRV